MKHTYLILIFSSLFIWGFTSCNNQNQSKVIDEDTTKKIADTTKMNYPKANKQKTDTIYKSFFFEDTLKGGYQFGMTVSQWNKHLATMAKNGYINELDEVRAANVENLIQGSYTGFYSEDKTEGFNKNRNGYYITGLFTSPKNRNDTVEIYKLNNKTINEPVLIGIQRWFRISDENVADFINRLVEIDNLNYLAGPNPQLPNNNPLTPEEFSDDIQEGLEKFAGAKIQENEQVTSRNVTSTLFEGRLFYCVIEATEKNTAYATRNADYKIVSIKNGFRDYLLVQKIYSKKQYDLRVSDYMTEMQKTNYDNKIKTKSLIDKALK